MTTVDGLGGVGSLGEAPRVGRGRRVAGGVGFVLPEPEAAAPNAAEIAGAAPAALLGALLGLQEAEVDGARNRTARRHGEAVLAELKALQAGLLGGAGGEVALKRLAGLSEGVPGAADPGLAAALQAVALRARVELARRQADSETASMSVA